MIRHKERLNSYSMMFNDEGYLISIKRRNRFLRFKQVEVIKDIINNLGTDEITLSDLRQVLSQYSLPKVSDLGDRILVEEIIL